MIKNLRLFAQNMRPLLQLYPLLLTLMLASMPAAARPLTVLVLGDSISAAYGIEEQQGWVKLLSQKLLSQNHDVRIFNASISGETTAGGRARLPSLLEQFKPQLVIIELGGNDGLRGYPIGAMRKNLKAMIEASQTSDAKVLLLGMQIPPNYGPRYSKLFMQSYFLLAEQHNIELVPFFLEGIGTEPELMQSDGIHPTAQAQPMLLENAWSKIKQLIDDLQVAHYQLQ